MISSSPRSKAALSSGVELATSGARVASGAAVAWIVAMPDGQIAISIGLPAFFAGAMAPDTAGRKRLSVGNCCFLQLLLGAEMCVKRPMGQAGGLHHFAYGHIVEPTFPDDQLEWPGGE
jgi:hypothetical protein